MLGRARKLLRHVLHRHGGYVAVGVFAALLLSAVMILSAGGRDGGRNVRPDVCAATRELVRKTHPPPDQVIIMLRSACGGAPVYVDPGPGS